MRRILDHLVPFVADSKSKKVFTSFPEVITDLWSRFDAVRAPPNAVVVLIRQSIGRDDRYTIWPAA